MDDVVFKLADEDVPRDRLALLLEHFSKLSDGREPWRVMYPLAEVLLLLTCATICSCDDFDEIAAWGQSHLAFLRHFSEFHFGIPSQRWLRDLVNRVDPRLFGRCFESWIAALWPDRHDLIAIDGKTSRRTHDKRKGLKALHTLSAYATNARLTLAQLSVPEKTNEMDHGADYLLALKGNQPNLEADVVSYFKDAPAAELVVKTTLEKGHGRLETRTYTASSVVDWIGSDRSYPGQPRFTNIRTILKVHDRVEYADRCSFETRYYISSATLDIERLSAGARGHWGVESMHWLLDVVFKDDLSRYRTGNGAKNMAVVRRFSLNLIRANKAKGSIKTKRKAAGWDPAFLLEILQQ